MVIRFQPSAPFGAKAGAITIVSNDPAGPHVVPVSGIVPAPKANLIIANTGSFGDVCVGSFADEPLIVTNSGRCTLSITGISSTSGEFLVPEVLSYPITIGPGDALPVPIRFKPLSFGAKAATITVTQRRSREPDQRQRLRRSACRQAHGRRLDDVWRRERGMLRGSHAIDLQYRRVRPRCDQRALQAQEPALEAAQQSLPSEAAAGLVPSGRHSISRRREVSAPLRAGDRKRRSRDAGQMHRGAGVHDLGGCCRHGCDGCKKEDCEDCRKGCCDKHPPCQQGYPCCDDDDDDDDDR